MAVNSVNSSNLLNLIKTMSKVVEAATQATQPQAPSSTPESNPYQSPFQKDGYDAGGAGGGDLASQLQQLTDTLGQLSEMLGGEDAGQGVQDLGGNGTPPPGGQPPGAPQSKQAAPPSPAAPLGTPDGHAVGQPAGKPEQQPAAPGAPKTAEAQKASGNNPTGGTGNTLDFTNDGNKPMNITFTPNAGGQQIPPITLQPGESMRQEFPKGWNGNFRSDSGDPAAATLGEVAFNGGVNGDQTFYDVSYIEGNNAAMEISPESGGKTSGTMKDIVSDAPDSIKVRDANGNVTGIEKSTNAEVRNQDVINYYRGKVGADEGYVDPYDDLSSLGTNDSHLEVHIKDVF